MGRWVGLALLSTIVGCYPEFGFVADDAAPPIADSSVADSSNDAIFPTDDTAAGPDSVVVDTAMTDTSVPPKDGCDALSGWVLCRDFDDVPSAGAGWGGTYTTGTSALFLDSYRSHSSTISMKSSVGPSTGVSAGNVYSNFTASTALSPMAVDFWAWFDKVPTAEGPMLIKMARDSANRGLSIYLGFAALAVDVNSPSGTTNHKMTGTIYPARWYHIRLEGVLSATTSGWFKLYLDDMKNPVLTRTGLATTTVDGTDIKLNVGFYIDGAPVGYNAWFDDVAFYWL